MWLAVPLHHTNLGRGGQVDLGWEAEGRRKLPIVVSAVTIR
jgi:hypothetical protein